MAHGCLEYSNPASDDYLQVPLSGPMQKDDGGLYSPAEWAAKNYLVVQTECDKKENGLLGELKKLMLDDVLRGNAALREHVASLEAQVASLQKQLDGLNGMQREVRALRDENAVLRDENAALRDENKVLRDENAALRVHVASLEAQVVSLEAQVASLQKQLDGLNGMKKVILRKMLDACRLKCKGILQEQNVAMPHMWNEVLEDVACREALQKAGLSLGLESTRYRAGSVQRQGLHVACSIFESPEILAAIVCKLTGGARERMLNVFSFVFRENAEVLAFSSNNDHF